jgi:hypothetical protein
MKYLGENNLNSFFEYLKLIGHKMNPCTKDEIEMLHRFCGKGRLPQDYIIFMEFAGNGIRFLRGSSYAMEEIFKLKEWAIELLNENNSAESLNDNDFVFFMHQGYQFYFFKLNEGENPPVYFYSEGQNGNLFKEESESFSNFIISFYNEIAKIIKD